MVALLCADKTMLPTYLLEKRKWVKEQERNSLCTKMYSKGLFLSCRSGLKALPRTVKLYENVLKNGNLEILCFVKAFYCDFTILIKKCLEITNSLQA